MPAIALLKDEESDLFVFYDPNQQIYGDGPAAELGLKSITLKYNCRNTGNIAKYSCKLIDMAPILKHGTPAGADVVVAPPCADERVMVDAVRKCVHRLVSEGNIKPQQIVVLTTGSVKASPVYRAKKLGNLSIVGLDQAPSPNEIRMDSLHRFKGLESDVVIVCDVKPDAEESLPKHLYVATSRACHYLAVFKYA